MSRTSRRIDPAWDPRADDHPTADPAWPEAHTDIDRHIIGTILNAKGQPLHTVRARDAVDFGFRGRR